jgi:hypothetical protein
MTTTRGPDHREMAIEPASRALEVREALDEAVRALAVSGGTLRERLHAAGTAILGSLSSEDFVEQEERELFDQIRIELTKLGTRPGRDGVWTTVERMSETAAEQAASDIIDLRDTVMGRAIRQGKCRIESPRALGDAISRARASVESAACSGGSHMPPRQR